MHLFKFAVFVVKTLTTSSKVDAILNFGAKLRDFPAGKIHCRRFFPHMGDGGSFLFGPETAIRLFGKADRSGCSGT